MTYCGKEKLFNITIFTYEDWDEIDTDMLQFYNVEFQFDSMKQYNGYDCTLDRNGEICIYGEGKQIEKDCYESVEVYNGFVCDIPEFMDELMKRKKN